MFFKDEAQRVAGELASQKISLVTLEGPLGAGKTTFTKALLQTLGYDSAKVQSPTFLKLLEYRVPDFGLVLHLDGYRMESLEAYEKLGLEHYLEAKLWIVEWPELFINYLRHRPELRTVLGIEKFLKIEIKTVGEKRTLSLNPASF